MWEISPTHRRLCELFLLHGAVLSPGLRPDTWLPLTFALSLKKQKEHFGISKAAASCMAPNDSSHLSCFWVIYISSSPCCYVVEVHTPCQERVNWYQRHLSHPVLNIKEMLMENGLFMAPFIDHLWPLQVLCEFTRSLFHPCTDGRAQLTGAHVYWPHDWWLLISSRVCVSTPPAQLRENGRSYVPWFVLVLESSICLLCPCHFSFVAKTSQHAALLHRCGLHTGRRACICADHRGQMRPNRTLEMHYLGYTQDRIKQNTTPKGRLTGSTFYFKLIK